MNKLFFSTTNLGKLKEAKDILKIDIEGISLEIDEIQSLDPVQIATKKALGYYSHIKQPLFVDDAALTFNALKQLPGPYMGDFIKALGVEGLLS
jgi:inosine/xanthosine triphosphate pyrophosphatase family protein